MSWEDTIKEDGRKIFSAGKRTNPRLEYFRTREFYNDVRSLEEILSRLPINMFHDLVRDFKELVEKYEKFDGAGRLK
tara:strand:- start:6031 stop:6261 length:231 start_codon:yes stop_codon:yes gene_type:complete